jgi:putative PIN family toxin of toxin-antitoxin system
MAKKADRIILDTNLWISFLITKDFKKLDDKIKTGKVKVLFSLESIEEFLAVAGRPKFKKYFSKEDLEQLIDLFDVYGETVDVSSKVSICRDPKDNFLLSLSKDSKADYLITGDEDLLEVRRLGKTKIIRISDYLKKFK